MAEAAFHDLELNGLQRRLLCDAIVNAFPSYNALNRMMSFQFDLALESIVAPDDLSTVAFNLVQWAEAQGYVKELVTKSLLENSRNPKLKAFADKLLKPTADDPRVERDIRQLADEYLSVRAKMEPCKERTIRMEQKVTQMRVLALAGWPLLAKFTRSFHPGERLAACLILQLKPDVDFVAWLSDRICVEKPFVGLHAAVALQVAAGSLDMKHKQYLKEAIGAALKFLDPRKTDSDRYKTLEKARKMLHKRTA